MNKEEINYILESLRFKTSIYRDKKKRNLTFNDDDYYSNILIEYIEQLRQENNQLKEQKKELRSWLEERVFYLNSVFDRDIYEEQMMLDFSNILIKLNELEEGKNE
jgi:hypothetical protein